MTRAKPNASDYKMLTAFGAGILLIAFLISVYSSLTSPDDEEWAILLREEKAWILANVGEKTPSGMWLAHVSLVVPLQPHQTSVTLDFIEIRCDERQYRLTENISHYASGQKSSRTREESNWRNVPPVSTENLARLPYEIFCNDADFDTTSQNPFQVREAILDLANGSAS